MRKVYYEENIDRHVNCPYCGQYITDDNDFDTIESRESVQCSSCSKRFQVGVPWKKAYQKQSRIDEYSPNPKIIEIGSIWAPKSWTHARWEVMDVNSESVNIRRRDIPPEANPEWKEFNKEHSVSDFLYYYRRMK